MPRCTPPFEKAMDEAHVMPILFTDAKAGVGVAELLDAIVKHFPSPRRAIPRRSWPANAGSADEKPFTYANDPTKPLLAHVFKVTTDPFVGKLAVFRVHQGKPRAFAGLHRHNKKPSSSAMCFTCRARSTAKPTQIIAGDIGAVAKIDDIHTNDVLHDDHALDSVHLETADLPHADVRPGGHPQGARRRTENLRAPRPKLPRKTRPSNGTPIARRMRWSSTAWANCTCGWCWKS